MDLPDKPWWVLAPLHSDLGFTAVELDALAQEHARLTGAWWHGAPYVHETTPEDPLGVLEKVIAHFYRHWDADFLWPLPSGWHRLVAETDRRLAELSHLPPVRGEEEVRRPGHQRQH